MAIQNLQLRLAFSGPQNHSIIDHLYDMRLYYPRLIPTKFNQLLSFTNSFYKKALELDSEVDSSNVTLSVRPTVNSILENSKVNEILQKAVQNLINKKPDLKGSFMANSFITNAVKQGSKWIVDPKTSGLVAKGEFASDPSIRGIVSKVNAACIQALNKEFNRVSANWTGNKVTNHQSDVNEVVVQT